MKFHQLHPRDQLVEIMSRIYRYDMTTLSGGNLSIKEPNGDMWITPAGTDKGQMVPDDIVRMRADGSVEGDERPGGIRVRPSSEHPFHRAIYDRRPDLGAIVHAHPPALVTYSIVHRLPDTCVLPHAWRMCGRAGYAPYALMGSEQLGEIIAGTFAAGYHAVLLENHGIVTAGPDLLAAYGRLEALELHARTLLQAHRVGDPVSLTEEQLALAESDPSLLTEFTPEANMSAEGELRRQVAHTVRRACDRLLMTSTQGVVSARVEARSFLITPDGLDRASLEAEDVVLIRDGQREAGKLPAASVHLHAAIYDAHPEIRCVIEAQPPSAMAFAVTAAPLDTRTIPESYILLRDVARLPYGVRFHAPQEVAGAISPRQPVLLLQNDAVLTVGHTVLAAFDRLEVAEFSARALVDTGVLGALAPIGEQGIADLEAKFRL